MSSPDEYRRLLAKSDSLTSDDRLEQSPSRDVAARYQVSDKEQTRIRRAFDRRMLPIVCILYMLSYLDRGNIGNARTAGAQDDLNLSSAQWTWVLNGFYICYISFEWTIFLWKLLPAHVYVAALCCGWGICAICSGLVKNMASLVAARCLLGIFEASFGVGAPYYLSLFYQRNELAKRVSLLLGMSPLANCLAGVLAYGVTRDNNIVEPWRWLFIIEGVPIVLFASVVYLFLPDGPSHAGFLEHDEQTLSIERMSTRDRTAKDTVNWSQFFAGLLDYRNLVHTLIHFACNYSFAGLSNFLPTIIHGMGYSSTNAQGLTAPVYLVSFLLCVLTAFASDRCGKRGLIVAACSAMGCIGYLLLAITETAAVRYCGVWLAVCGIFPALCINITWLLNNNGGDSKRGAGLAFLATFGQCSSLLSSVVFPRSDGPYFVRGCAIGCGFTGMVVTLSMGLVWGLHTENKKKDQLYGTVDDDDDQIDVSAEGDKHPRFRYLL